MEIKKFVVGEIGTNCYIIKKNKKLIVIDPGGLTIELKNELEDNSVDFIILTHNHYDHIASVSTIKSNNKNSKIIIHKKDSDTLNDPTFNGSLLFGVSIEKIFPDIIISENISMDFENEKIHFYHTPGHTEGSISFIIRDNLFTGDILFKNGVGRYDLPSGDLNKLKSSLNFYYTFNKNFKVYPGHGDLTDLDAEKFNLSIY